MRCQPCARIILLLHVVNLINWTFGINLDIVFCGERTNLSEVQHLGSGGFTLSISHPVFNPLIDLIPRIEYTIILSHKEIGRRIYELEFIRTGNSTEETNSRDTLKNNNTSESMFYSPINCTDLQTPVKLTWTPKKVIRTCINLRLIVTDTNGAKYLVNKTICQSKGCRKYIEVQHHGYLSSPGYPYRYPDNSNCTYILYTTGALPLNLQDFEIESAYEDECYDFVLIRFDNFTAKTCGSKSKSELRQMFYKSFTGAIIISLISDNKLVKKGFKAVYYVTERNECNVTLNSTKGFIRSPNYPDVYFPNLFCVYRIILPFVYRIRLRLQFLDLEDAHEGQCDNDNLTVSCDDDSSAASTGGHIAPSNNTTLPLSFIGNNISRTSLVFCGQNLLYSNQSLSFDSSASVFYVTLKTNHLIENGGFVFSYESFMSCENQTFYEDSGFVSSTNFPAYYLNNQDCLYRIHSEKESFYVEFIFSIFHTESVGGDRFLQGDLCKTDFIEIFEDGKSTKYCGHYIDDSPFVFRSEAKSFHLRFVTDYMTTKPGFYARWRVVETNASSQQCASTWIDFGDYNFEVVREPRTWSESLKDCESKGALLVIIPNMETQKVIEADLKQSNNCTVNMDSFWIGASDIEYENDFFWPDGSRTRFNYWFPGWSQYQNANKQPSDDGFSDEDCVEIRRTFNYPTKGQGRMEEYWWNDRNCNIKNPYICQHYKKGITMPSPKQPIVCNKSISLKDEETTYVSSPSYPSTYPDHVDCFIIISYPTGIHPQITFQHFDLENESRCVYDNLTLLSYPGDQAQTVNCGNWNRKLKMLTWTSVTNVLILRFQSDHSVSQTGFEAQISQSKDFRCDNVNTTQINSYRSLNTTATRRRFCYTSVFQTRLSYNSAKDACFRVGGDLVTNGPQLDFWKVSLLHTLQGESELVIWIGKSFIENSTGSFCKVITLRNNIHDKSTFTGDKRMSCDQQMQFICQIPVNKKVPITYSDTYDTFNGTIQPLLDLNGQYLTNYDHKFEIRTNSSYRIFIKLLMLDIEYQEKCLYDYLMINGVLEKGIYCGVLYKNETPVFLLSRSNVVTVNFHSDSTLSSAGFNLSWSSINPENCLHYTNNYTSIQSINYPFPVGDNVSCCENFTAKQGHRVIFQMNTFYFNQYCNNVNINVIYKDQQVLKLCNSTDILNMFNPVVSARNSLEVCFNANYIGLNEGFTAVYSFVKADDIKLEKNIYFSDDLNKTGTIQNLHYPDNAAMNTCQIIHLYAPIGYNIVLTFSKLQIEVQSEFADTYLEISDHSLGNSNIFNLENWTYSSKPAKEDLPVVIQSYLNDLKVKFVSGERSGKKIFTANYRLETDPEYLTKTKFSTDGSIDSCGENTCLNNGTCIKTSEGRYRCDCEKSYTGFFCQVTWCELAPCVHGLCGLSGNRYNCTCDEEYYGSKCNITYDECNQVYCSGRGVCSETNRWIPKCTCLPEWEGLTCSVKISGNKDSSKTLLGEPIWIGLIVILGILFAFGVLIVFKRNCGRYFQCCDGPKQMIKRRDAKRNTNSLSIATTPASPAFTEPNVSKFPALAIVIDEVRNMKDKEKRSESSTAATTPTIDSKNERAAARLYASFRSNSVQYPTVTQNRATLDPSSAVNVGGLVGGTLAFTDIDSENSMSEKVVEKYALKPPQSPFNYKRNRTLTQNKSQSENNSQSSNQQFDINDNVFPQKSRSLENPPLHYYPDIVIVNDNEIRQLDIPSNEDEIEMIEMATLSVPDNLHREETDETEDNEVSFTNLDASSKRRIFASKARSDCGVIYDDHHSKLIDSRRNCSSHEMYPLSFSEYSSEEGLLPLSFETEYGIIIPKRHMEMQRAVMSYDDLLLEKYFQEDELRRHRRRLTANVRSTSSLRDHRHYDSSLYSYRDENYHRHKHRHRRQRSRNRNQYVIKLNRRPSKLQSSDSDRYSSHRSRSTSLNGDHYITERRSMDKKSFDNFSRRSYQSKHSLENSMDNNYKTYANSKNLKKHRPMNLSDSSSEKESSLKRPIRKSRSNDLNLNSFSVMQTRDLKLMSEPSLLRRSNSKRRRRHSFHSPKVSKKLYPHPDELLDQQTESVDGMQKTFESSVLDEKKNISYEQPVDANSVTVQSTTHPSFLSVTDTDTGFDSTSKSIYSSPRRESKDEIISYAYKSEQRVKDSAYQTNQSSMDRNTIDNNPIIDIHLERHMQNGKRNDDKKVYKQLEMAAKKLAIFQSNVYKNRMSKDSAVNFFSEDELNAEDSDASSREHPPLRRTSGSGLFPLFQLEQVSEEGDIYTPETLSVTAHDGADNTIFIDHTPTNGDEYSEFPA